MRINRTQELAFEHLECAFFFTQMSNIYGRGGTNLTNCNRAYIIFTYFFIIGVIACESSDTFFRIYTL